MNMRKKIIALLCVVLVLVMAFFAGFFVGKNVKYTKRQRLHNGYISFYSVKKYAGQETNDEEKQVLKLFVGLYEDCIRTQLDDRERAVVSEIQKEVLAMAADNDKIKFKLQDLKAVQNEAQAKQVVKKIKRCQRHIYKQLSKDGRGLFKRAISKLSISNVITVFHGIR